MTDLTMTDLFCGAGGSTTGAVAVPGVRVRLAVNHWAKAIETHNTNYPSVDHLQADISQTDPRYVPHTDLLWGSPECTNHSRAKGIRNWSAPDLFGDTLPPEAVQRSRATMWDIVRFTEAHRYRAVVVENVVEIADWGDTSTMRGGLYKAWLAAMAALGYQHRVLSLNAMHAQRDGLPAPQSRDRVFVVFWRRDVPTPDLESVIRPPAWCPSCGQTIHAIQAWKNPDRDPDRPGRYRQQYVYRCPNHACRGQQVEPAWLPASTIIDWTDLGTPIGDRPKPLSDKTLARIQAGINRYWTPLVIEAAGNTWDMASGASGRYLRAWPTDQPVRTIHGTESKALVVPVEGRAGTRATDAGQPRRTMTIRNESGIAFPPLIAELHGGGSTCRPADRPLSTVLTSGGHHALIVTNTHQNRAHTVDDPLPTCTTATGGGQAIVVPYYGHGVPTTVDQALPTVVTHDRFALVMRNQTLDGDPGYLTTPVDEPIRTVTTTASQSLLTADYPTVNLDQVRFRMLQPGEIKQAQAFPVDYQLLGNRREQVRLAGNAVPPPCARDILTAIYQAVTR